MKSMVMFLLLFIVIGCGGSAGQDAEETRKAAGLENLKKTPPRGSADIIKTQWERFGQADDDREQDRAIDAIARIGANAESEIPKLQEIADNPDYSDNIRQQAENAIKYIKEKVEEAN